MMASPPTNEAFHQFPTPYLVMGVFDPPLRAKSALKLPVEYGLFIEGFSRVSLVGSPDTSIVSVSSSY
jgi:hypothetical protein